MSHAREPQNLILRPATPDDHSGWGTLFREYAHIGGVTLSDAQVERVWGWISADAGRTRCVLAVNDESPVGFVHYRPFERPITASVGLWIDDVYVQPSSRGQGIAGALIDAIRAQAGAGGYDVIRWTTRESNTGARKLYDRIAVPAPVVVYNADPLRPQG